MANWRIGAEQRTGNADYSRFNGGGDYNPNAGIIAPAGGRGFYDPHGSDRFRFSPPARMSFREGRGRDVDYGGNVGSPGNWGWKDRTHLGNDQQFHNAARNGYGFHNPHPAQGMDRNFGGGGNRGHGNQGPSTNYYGGRTYPTAGSRINGTVNNTVINQRGTGNSAAVSNGGGSATATSNVTQQTTYAPTYVRHYW